MRRFRRLPPLLRVADILALLLALAAIALIVEAFITSLSSVPPRWPVDALVIALNLGMLGGSCSFVVQTYGMRFRRPGGGPFPLDSWQSQGRAIVLLAALPLCALVLAVAIPPTASAFGIVFPISIIGACVLLGARLWLNIGRQAMG